MSASANKLSKIKDDAEEYAALIMEELDPDNLGYIEVCIYFPPLYHNLIYHSLIFTNITNTQDIYSLGNEMKKLVKMTF